MAVSSTFDCDAIAFISFGGEALDSSHGDHAIGEASSECMSGGVGHYVEAIAHVITHHSLSRFLLCPSPCIFE